MRMEDERVDQMITRDPNKWAMRILLGILVSTIGIGGFALLQIGRVRTTVGTVQTDVHHLVQDVGKLESGLTMVGQKLSSVVEIHISSLDKRLTALENKGILPRARQEIDQIHVRLRELERRSNAP